MLHDLTMFVRQARCDELRCIVHPSMPQTWLVLYVARRCSTSPLHCVARRSTTSCRFLCSLATALRSHRLAGIALLLMLPAHVAPTVLGGTARGLSCTCAVGLVHVRRDVRVRRPLCVCVCARYAMVLKCARVRVHACAF